MLQAINYFETGWDLGPFAAVLQCLHLDKRLLEQQNKRNYKGVKITACMLSWGNLWTRRYKKTKKTQLPLLKSWEQKQGTAHAPCTHHQQRGGQNT